MIGSTADQQSVVVTLLEGGLINATIEALASLHESGTEREDVRDVPVRESEEVGTEDSGNNPPTHGVVNRQPVCPCCGCPTHWLNSQYLGAAYCDKCDRDLCGPMQ